MCFISRRPLAYRVIIRTACMTFITRLLITLTTGYKCAFVMPRCQRLSPPWSLTRRRGSKFLYDACVALFKEGQRYGAILAHCMGLGKTLQVHVYKLPEPNVCKCYSQPCFCVSALCIYLIWAHRLYTSQHLTYSTKGVCVSCIIIQPFLGSLHFTY